MTMRALRGRTGSADDTEFVAKSRPVRDGALGRLAPAVSTRGSRSGRRPPWGRSPNLVKDVDNLASPRHAAA